MAKKPSKRYQQAKKLVPERSVTVEEAIGTIKQFPPVKFDETVELNFQLGVDPKQSNQAVRGTVSLPHGTGKSVKVLVFCRGEESKEAEASGADYIGSDELIDKVAKGWTDFDVVIAHPNVMKDISKLGKVLGPRGLMPSPKVGTVTQDIGKAVAEVKKGKIEFKSDKTGGLHVPCGKLSFTKEALVLNTKTILKMIIDHKPPAAKGTYLKSITISTTMGPGISIDNKSVTVS
jgi:large subunit ribosomal protein L1